MQAVKNIDFHVNAGQLFAFLGPNGAGKSTTIDIICTLLQADSGEVRINGYILGKDKDENYYVMCLSGARSTAACQYLASKGYKVTNVMGGISAWRGEVV